MRENSVFEKIEILSLDGDYNKCEFVYCDFADAELHNVDFEKCTFRNCNFSLNKFARNFKDASFIDCKMTGADFTNIGKFSGSFYFERAKLDYANFSGVKIRKSIFRDCKMEEADFDEADLSFSIFDKCDLSRSSFLGANLERVDFYSSYNFSINPTSVKLKKTIFSEQELKGLVSHLNIIIK